MKYSDIKTIKAFCNNLISMPDWREVADNISDDIYDFTVNNVRFIAGGIILETLADELEAEEYILGCFNSSAIAEATGWPVALIEAAQSGEAYQEIGEAMSREHIERLAEIYASADGYGHHFNSHDFGEEEITVCGVTYHVFDNH